ncbi:MAG: hypothetical protein JWP00_1534 [Chloroflexi bacterium]|jgi:hypothetical protein|nr:hypothetical protein [Chloroflexota bacterium]
MPDDSNESRLTRVESLYNQGLKHAAAQLSRLVLEKDSSNIQALVWLAKCTSQADEAEKATRRAASLQPDNPLVRDLLASRQPVGIPGNGGAAGFNNPYSVPQPAYNPVGEPNQGNSQPWGSFTPVQGSPDFAPPPPSNYSTNQQSNSSFDYLRNLSASVQPSVPPVRSVGSVKVRKSFSPVGLIFGLLFLIAGLGLAAYWSWQVVDFMSDASKTGSQLQGQIVKLGSNELEAEIKDAPLRKFAISEQVNKSLVPLVSDPKTKDSLVSNQVVLNITPAGRLLSVQVLTPTRGSVNNTGNGLLGLGQAADWIITALGGILAIVGLILLGRTLGKRRT